LVALERRFLDTAALSKKFAASRALLRKNSYALPWNWLVPERVTALMTPPEVLPYSADILLVSTENSSMESTPTFPPRTLPDPPLAKSSMLMPSRR